MYKVEYRGFSEPLLALRGLAASGVLIYHALLTFLVLGVAVPYDYSLIARPQNFQEGVNFWLAYIFNGQAAVIFFFVHSGFVLALSISRMRWNTPGEAGVSYSGYLTKRFFRLIPMVIYSGLVYYAYLKFTLALAPQPVAEFSPWYDKFFAEDRSVGNLLRNILMTRDNLNPFLWSIKVEVIASIVMPVLFLASRSAYGLALGAVVMAVALALGDGGDQRRVIYYASFLLGAALANEALARFYARWLADRRRLVALLIVAILWLPVSRYMIPWLPAGIAGESLAAAVIVATIYYADGTFLHRFCSLRFVKFLGDISFSFYLNSLLAIHVSGLLVGHLLPQPVIAAYGAWCNIAVLILSFAMNCVLSQFTWRYVELPFQNLGRRLAGRIRPRRLAVAD
jgi:peptidoglycan/LPS O-acetylase OafA/YrhL